MIRFTLLKDTRRTVSKKRRKPARVHFIPGLKAREFMTLRTPNVVKAPRGKLSYIHSKIEITKNPFSLFIQITKRNKIDYTAFLMAGDIKPSDHKEKSI
jgi:hypothetical protein